jgi:hypothetical protein
MCLACGTGADGPTLELPDRPDDAAGGTEIAQDIRALDFEAREERIYAEVARGNVPAWMRQFGRITMTGEIDGRAHDVTLWVMRDYLAVGSDDDFFFVPLSPGVAQRIADLVGASLPTARLVDAIWAAARVKLTPIRIRPDESTRTFQYFERHNALVQAQRRLHGGPPGAFVAGHKLDVVRTPSSATDSAQYAVYGWHHSDGTPIQPLHPVAVDSEPRFNMGVRLVDLRILVDGESHELSSALQDPRLARILNGAAP